LIIKTRKGNMEEDIQYKRNGVSEIFKFLKSDFTQEDWVKLIEFYTQGEQNAELV